MSLENQSHTEFNSIIVLQDDICLLKYACMGILLGIITLILEPVFIGWYRRRYEKNDKEIFSETEFFIIEDI